MINKKIIDATQKKKEGQREKIKTKRHKPQPESQIIIASQKERFEFLKRKSEEELIKLIKESRAGPLQRAAIEELSSRAASAPEEITLMDSYSIIIKYSNNKIAREKLINNMNKPILLDWVIRNCPFEDSREIAKKRLTEILNRPKV